MTWKQRVGKATPLILLTILTTPVVVGYIWIIISTFSQRTYGLVPVDHYGKFGGLTLENWSFLWDDPNIWSVTLNTLFLAVLLTVGVLVISAMAGYALSRISFPGRKAFLGGTLILHAFPSVTLLISIYFVLRELGKIPVLGKGLPIIGGFGYNTVGGVALVMVALQLPLGVWLMKGFFDNVSWDMERAALIDGCSRLRVWWEIMLPSIRPCRSLRSSAVGGPSSSRIPTLSTRRRPPSRLISARFRGILRRLTIARSPPWGSFSSSRCSSFSSLPRNIC
jgi:inositol-phosphate transport system permease protein